MLGAGNQESRGRRERDKDGGRAEERGGESIWKWEGIASVHGLIGGYFPCSYFGKYPEFC